VTPGVRGLRFARRRFRFARCSIIRAPGTNTAVVLCGLPRAAREPVDPEWAIMPWSEHDDTSAWVLSWGGRSRSNQAVRAPAQRRGSASDGQGVHAAGGGGAGFGGRVRRGIGNSNALLPASRKVQLARVGVNDPWGMSRKPVEDERSGTRR